MDPTDRVIKGFYCRGSPIAREMEENPVDVLTCVASFCWLLFDSVTILFCRHPAVYGSWSDRQGCARLWARGKGRTVWAGSTGLDTGRVMAEANGSSHGIDLHLVRTDTATVWAGSTGLDTGRVMAVANGSSHGIDLHVVRTDTATVWAGSTGLDTGRVMAVANGSSHGIDLHVVRTDTATVWAGSTGLDTGRVMAVANGSSHGIDLHVQ